MKKVLSMILVILLALSAAGCGSEENPSSEPATSNGLADALNIYRDLSFLNYEQQELFAQGEQIYFIFFGRSYNLDLLYPAFNEDEFDEDGNRLSLGPEIQWGKYGFRYEPTWGSYREWEELEKMVLTAFTEDGFRELSGLNAIADPSDINDIKDLNNLNQESELYPAFLNVQGRLYRNYSFYHMNDSLIDEYYELVEQTEERVFFYQVCAYKEGYPNKMSGEIQTYAFPIEMLRTPDGWRLQQFTDGALEPDPERKGSKHPSVLLLAAETPNLYRKTDFLSREQQELFEKGERLHSLFFERALNLEDEFPAPNEADARDEEPWNHTIRWGGSGYLYQPAVGLCREWDDFEKMVLSVYTEDWFREANDMDTIDEISEINDIKDLSSLNKDSLLCPAFLNVDGRVYCNTNSKNRNTGLIDEYYELVEQTEERVNFYRICAYKEMYPGEMSREICTYAFPIELLRTPEGWRIQRFARGKTELNPEQKGIKRETIFLPAPEKEAPPKTDPSSEPAPAAVSMDLGFLTQEQQELFQKGDQTYLLFQNRAEDIEWGEFRDPAISAAEGNELSRKDFEDRIEWGKYGWPYGPFSTSLYRNWDDFEKMILSIYTEECFWEMNGMNAVEDVRDINDIQDLNDLNRECEEFVAFLNVNGKLYGSMGVNTGNGSLIGEYYELVEQTEDRVFFYRVCSYQDCYWEESDRGICTYAFPIELLRTPEGWRIQQFTDGRLELNPAIKGTKR